MRRLFGDRVSALEMTRRHDVEKSAGGPPGGAAEYRYWILLVVARKR